MPLRKSRDATFVPRSVVDALDGGQVQPGGMRAATNLVFDPSNPGCLECRPATIKQFDFTGITGAGVVSASYIVGDICYGLIASSKNSGHDEPFAYNIATDTLLTVTGTINSSTTPVTQSTSGEWTPPTMALVGILLYVTHPGFAGGVGAYFGWFDVTTPASPVWHAGNVGSNPLVAVPTSVGQFFNRAWFSVGQNMVYTDTLANNATNATQVLTVGDSSAIVAQSPIPMGTSVQGILQGLAVFKNTYVAIISGDDTQGNLTLNIISSTIGTYSPRSVAVTSLGIMFAAVDGIRSLTSDSLGNGSISPVNPDLRNPFIFMLNKSRCSAQFNNNIYRITCKNGDVSGQPVQEYWFDFAKLGWTGPHTFTQSLAVLYKSSFICFNDNNAASMYLSDVNQSLTSTFVENSSDMSWKMITAPLQDDGGVFEGTAILTVIDLELPNNGIQYNFAASDVNDGVLATAKLITSIIGSIWGSFLWGTGVWGAASYGLDRYNIPWSGPLVFSRLVFQASTLSSLGFKLGKFVLTYQPTGYVKK